MKLLLALIVNLMVMPILIGCNDYVQRLGPHNAPLRTARQPTFNKATLDYALIQTVVLQPRCLNCHSAANGNKGQVNLESYANVIAQLDDIKTDIEDGSMPKDGPPLTDSEKAMILAWIGAGAPESGQAADPVQPGTGPTPAPAPAPSEPEDPSQNGSSPPIPDFIDYKTVYREVIQKTCFDCHAAPKNRGDINLETYKETIDNLFDIEADIRDGSMPKKKKLTAYQKQLILKWIAQGAPKEARPGTGSIQPLPTKPTIIYKPKENPNWSIQQKKVFARGRYYFQLSSCNACHTADPAQPLAGGKALESPFGKFYVPNISDDPETGIGHWSDQEFVQAMRHGLNRKGENYYPSFPFTNYTKMTDQDILSVRFYLQQFPAVKRQNRNHELKFPYNQRALLNVWRWKYFPTVQSYSESNFLLARGPYQNIETRDAVWNRGAYLVEGPLHCTACHTPRDSIGGLLTSEWMAGSILSGGSEPAPNITPEPSTGLRTWSRRAWMDFLKTGKNPAGEVTGGEMKKVIQGATSQLTDSDKEAVIVYLQSLTPVVSKLKK